MSDSESFRVIIIGGGPTGLALAHMLHLANIDYSLYDKREDICEPHGAGLAIQPQNCRILEQLGIYDQVLEQGLAPEMRVHREVSADGTVLAEYPFFQWLKENHGYTMMLFERWQYIKLLYDTLPDRESHVFTAKTLQSLWMVENGSVGVRFTDGSEDKGSVVIGADGVYSKVRDCIIQHAPKHVFTHKPYRISFRALYGVGPLPTGMDPGVVREIPHQGWWFQIISQPQRIFWMLYQSLDRPLERPLFYGKGEAEALAAEHGDCPVGEGFTFKEIRASKTFEKLAVLEEGVAAKWYWKRVVLVGDAVHKVVIICPLVFHLLHTYKPRLTSKQTPNQAHGANIGLESAACLVNRLRSLLDLGTDPTETQLEQVFDAYQQDRAPMASAYLKRTSFHLRALAGAGLSPWQRFQSQYLFPRLGARWILDHHISPLQVQGVKLDFIESESAHDDIRFPYHDTERAKETD